MRATRFAIILLLVSSAAFAALQFPALTGRVVDEAHMLSPATIASLTQTLADYENDTSNQVVVVTLPSLKGLSIDDYGYQLGRNWHIGQKGKNNGVLLIVAPNERKVRIEVGYGLEPVLTDAASSAIVHSVILPAFRAGHMEQGVIEGTQAILSVLGGKGVPGNTISPPAGDSQGIMLCLAIILLFWLVMRFGVLNTLMVLNLLSNTRIGGSGLSGGWSSGGGFSGGGGSFGGGGASGGW